MGSLSIKQRVVSKRMNLFWRLVPAKFIMGNKIIKVLLIFSTVLASTVMSEAAEIMNVRHWTAPDHTRIVLDVDSESSFEVKEEGKVLSLDFLEATVRSSLPAEMRMNKPGIRKVRIHTASDGSVRIEFVLDKYLKTQVFKLKKFQDKPDRIVVDIFLEDVSSREILKDESAKIKKKKVIIVDPGHGGDDPGAVGRKRSYEKNIVLAISREIKKAINKTPGYRAVLTRDGDYYVSFSKRLQTARDLNASLFISVHADAARNRLARGTSVYCLSLGGASNEAAKLLASNENLSDIIGGVPNGEAKADSDQIILNMFQTNTINLSKTYAGNLMRHLDMVNSLKYKSVQEAPFRVLKLPDIPAVLIETAYISNSEEETLLKNGNFQKKLASAVASSIVEYLSSVASASPASDAADANDKGIASGKNQTTEKIKDSESMETSDYKVKQGDTVSSIARLFTTKVAVLLKLNNMKLDDPLFAGQKILVPARKDQRETDVTGNSRKNGSVKTPCKFYTVKKGDTLFSISQSNAVAVEELRKLNNMRATDHLLLGQKIKLP